MLLNYDVVIVGGGIVGASIAYHIATTSNRSVCLLEQQQLTSGTTWHAAGLVAELRASANLTRLAKYSGQLYESLENSGEGLGYRRVGALTLAKNEDRAFELKKQAAMARHNDVACEWLNPADIQEKFPHIETSDLVGAVYMPNDGQTNPVDTTVALARLAKAAGADIYEQTSVSEILIENGAAVGVVAQDQTIKAKQVVLAAGLWTRALGQRIGADFPLYPSEHFYAVTEPLDASGPIVRVPDDGIYIKPDAGRLLIGSFEREAKPIEPALIPDTGFVELPFDLDHLYPYLEAGLSRIVGAQDTGIRTWFNGPESFTPDGRYMLGESPQVQQLFVAAGFNSIGIQSAGGVGKVMAEWLEQRRPPMDLWEVDVRRFHPFQNEANYLVDRTAESLGLLYAMHWPFQQHESARDIRKSPFHDQVAAIGACHGELAGWERPNWYANAGQDAKYEYSYGPQNWFENTRREHAAVRSDVALFDQSSFAKYSVRGADACAYLNHLCTANVEVPPGQTVYCQFFNEQGGIEADVTITRHDTDYFWVVSAAACAVRDLHWMHMHKGKYAVVIEDITDQWAVLGIMGPNARNTLQPFTDTSLENDAFPFATSQNLTLAGVDLVATRLTYVGALGWELYIPTDQASSVYEAINETPIPHAGYHAMDSLRIEKGYRHWGHDICDEDTPLEAGLSFTVDWDKDGALGLDALRTQKAAGFRKRLVLFQLQDSEALLTHEEPIWSDGQRVSKVTSSAYGYSVNASLAFGYVEADSRKEILAKSFEVEIGDRRIGAIPTFKAVHDPQGLEIKV